MAHFQFYSLMSALLAIGLQTGSVIPDKPQTIQHSTALNFCAPAAPTKATVSAKLRRHILTQPKLSASITGIPNNTAATRHQQPAWHN